MSELQNIARQLRGVRLKSNSYLCHCPAHSDEKPSLTLTQGDDGKILFHCKAGCSQESVLAELRPFLESKEEPPRKVKEWIYKLESGEPHLRVSRFEGPKGKSFRQEHLDGTSWVSGGAMRPIAPLYYEEWKDESFVFFVEGEKCADALRDKLQPATCIPGGANGWKEYYGTFFKGKTVCILPDNDKAGEAFAQRVYESIKLAGGGAYIKKLNGLGDKEDAFEWLERGGDPLTLYPEKPKTLFEEIDSIIDFNKDKSIPFGVPLFDDAMGKINPTDLILLTGPSGMGKTQLATHIANQVCLEGKRVTFFSLESFHREIESRIIYTMLADKFYQDKSRSFTHIAYRLWMQGDPRTVSALGKYRKEVEESFKRQYGDRLNTVYRDSSHFSIKEFEKHFEREAPSSDLIIVDHLNYFDSHDEKKSENKVMEECMKRIRDCVLIAKKPVLLLTHVRKSDSREHKLLPDMEDIHGSSNIFKIATKSIIIGIDFSNDDKEYSRTLVKIPKDRYGEGLGRYIFRMNFSVKTRQYEGSYEVGRVAREKSREVFELLEPHKLPFWVRGEAKELEDEL